jgi:hypothetical protein
VNPPVYLVIRTQHFSTLMQCGSFEATPTLVETNSSSTHQLTEPQLIIQSHVTAVTSTEHQTPIQNVAVWQKEHVIGTCIHWKPQTGPAKDSRIAPVAPEKNTMPHTVIIVREEEHKHKRAMVEGGGASACYFCTLICTVFFSCTLEDVPDPKLNSTTPNCQTSSVDPF